LCGNSLFIYGYWNIYKIEIEEGIPDGRNVLYSNEK
jgi:hypothetical protein